jgi:hypothetical protein
VVAIRERNLAEHMTVGTSPLHSRVTPLPEISSLRCAVDWAPKARELSGASTPPRWIEGSKPSGSLALIVFPSVISVTVAAIGGSAVDPAAGAIAVASPQYSLALHRGKPFRSSDVERV